MRTYADESTLAARVVAESEPPESAVVTGARASLDGRRRGFYRLLPFLGPAFIASVAYIDPGNFATNIQGGSAFGYNLLWVIVLANVMAMLLQTMSAKLGLATGHNLAEMCRLQFRKPVVYGMWIVSEFAAMATDLAEFLGASIALNLLFGIPLAIATLITGVVTYLILLLERRGFRPVEAVITVLVGVIALCYVIETFFSHPNWGQVGLHSVLPWEGNFTAVLFSVGIIGATVMPMSSTSIPLFSEPNRSSKRERGKAHLPFEPTGCGNRDGAGGTCQHGYALYGRCDFPCAWSWQYSRPLYCL